MANAKMYGAKADDDYVNIMQRTTNIKNISMQIRFVRLKEITAKNLRRRLELKRDKEKKKSKYIQSARLCATLR